MATELGPSPVGYWVCCWKPPPILPSKTETVLESWLATARSDRPSPFRSPMATELGLVPVAYVVAAGKLPAPSLRKSETVLEPALATARSGRWSPFRSPMATELGLVPLVLWSTVEKVPLPLLYKSETVVPAPPPVSVPKLATARSCRPSPFRSPMATDLRLLNPDNGPIGVCVR